MNGEKRFNELKRSTAGRSRTLSNALESLTENEYIERRTGEAAPIAIYYSLSEKGAALEPVFVELDQWAREWVDEVPANPGRPHAPQQRDRLL